MMLQGLVFGMVVGVLQWSGGGSKGFEVSLQSLFGQVYVWVELVIFDSIDMVCCVIVECFDCVQVVLCLCGVWQSVFGEVGQGSFVGNVVDSCGWMVGQDLLLGSNGLMGVVFGEICSNGGSSFGGDCGCDCQVQVQLYVGWNLGWGYVLVQVGSGQFICVLDCQLLLGVGVYGVFVCYGGCFSSVSVEGGYCFGCVGVLFIFYVGVSSMCVDIDVFNELGGFGFGLCGEVNWVQCSQMLVGIRGECGWGCWIVCGYVEWQQWFDGVDVDWQVSFVGVDVWVLLVGWNVLCGSVLFGVVLELWWGCNGCLSLGFDQCVGGESVCQVVLCYSIGF